MNDTLLSQVTVRYAHHDSAIPFSQNHEKRRFARQRAGLWHDDMNEQEKPRLSRRSEFSDEAWYHNLPDDHF